MKKRGFTLIEMIVVLLLLGIVIVLVLPAVRGLTYNSNSKKYQQLEKTINEAAKLYSSSYQGELVNTSYECFNIPYSTLIKEGLIEEEDINCSGNIIMRKRKKIGYDYEQYLTCKNSKGEVIHQKKRPASLLKCIGFSGKFVVNYDLYTDSNYSNGYTQGNWEKYVYSKYKSESPYGSGIEKYQYTKDLINWIDITGDSETYTNFNGNVYVRAIDQDGNISSMAHHLIKTDTMGPSFSLSNNENAITENNTMVVNVSNVSDKGIGIESGGNIYSFDNGSTWVNNSSKEYLLASTGTIQVKDKLGNVTTQPVSVIKACSGSLANATSDKILTGYSAWVNGSLVNGTMKNNGAVNIALNSGDSYTVPAGYHNGSGKITTKTLAEQTPGTATADNITEGKTAWVNGKLITGTGADVKSSYTNSISALYNSQAITESLGTTGCYSSAHNNQGSWYADDDNFNYSKTLSLYETSEKKHAALNIINFNISCSSDNAYSETWGRYNMSYSVTTNNGKSLASGSISGSNGQTASRVITINLFASQLGDAKEVTISISGNTSARAATHKDSQGRANVTVTNIYATYLPME